MDKDTGSYFEMEDGKKYCSRKVSMDRRDGGKNTSCRTHCVNTVKTRVYHKCVEERSRLDLQRMINKAPHQVMQKYSLVLICCSPLWQKPRIQRQMAVTANRERSQEVAAMKGVSKLSLPMSTWKAKKSIT